jgi:hypothetical protein
MKATKEEIKRSTAELNEQVENKEIEEGKIKFKYLYEHLPHFDKLLEIINLEGKEYTPIIKGCYFHILSRLATDLFPCVKVGGLRTDLRIHLTIPLSSGQGKKNIKSGVNQVFTKLEYKGHVPTSFHPEQFIGKVLNRGTQVKPKWIKNEGYLSRDYIILDEAYNLLMSRDNQIQETRKNFRIAKDPIGENLVEKKSVDNTFDEEERIAYHPKEVSIQFLQPKHLSSNIVEEGDFRRDLVLYKKGIATRNKTKDYENRIMKIDNSVEALKSFTEYLKLIKKEMYGCKFSFTEEAVKRIVELHSKLVYQGFHHSEKGANYSKMVDYTLQDFLVKISCLIGIANNKYEIDKDIIDLAFVDLIEFFTMQLDFVNDKVLGKLDYGEGWQGAKEKDQECLEWLYHAGNDGKEVTLDEFKKEIARIKGCGLDMAQKSYQKYARNDWIKINHEFQKYSVTLAFTHAYIESKLKLHAGNEMHVGNAYESIILNKKAILSRLPTLPTLPTLEVIK